MRFLLMLVVLLTAVPLAAENTTPAATPGFDRQLLEENERLRQGLERRETEMRTLEYQLQQAQEELARTQQTITVMQQELQELVAELAQLRATTPRAAARPATAGTTPAPARPRPAVSPNARRHTVAAGETLAQIAEKYYGAGASWQRIFDANTDKLTSPQVIVTGMTLVIP